MAKTKVVQEDVAYAMDRLLSYAPQGRRVYTVLRHVSRSGMSREISLFVADARGGIICIDYYVKTVFGRKIGKHGGIVIRGCGMDMGYALVHDLGEVLHKSGYSLNHEWI